MNDLIVKVCHASMQFSDKASQKEHDIKLIFSQDFDWITGTEANGSSTLWRIIRLYGKKYGYIVYKDRQSDSWIAVKKQWAGPWYRTLASRAILVGGRFAQGSYSTKKVIGFRFRIKGYGTFTVFANHYLTKKHPKWKNIKLIKAINQWAAKYSAGSLLAFYGGDQNMDDKHLDTFMGGIFISCWDELKKYPSTHEGDGTIDLIARSKKDGRVSCINAVAVSQTKSGAHMDHKLVIAKYRIKPL